MRIPEGSIVYNLTCEYSGVPTPKVAWAKNGSVCAKVMTYRLGKTWWCNKAINPSTCLQEIPAEFKVENYPALGKSVLFFPESAIQNETEVTGNYTCAVANFVSRTQKEYEVLYGTLDEELSTTTAYTQETTQIYESLENTDTTPLITVTEEVMNKTETPRPKKV